MGVSEMKCRHKAAKAVTLDRTGADDAHLGLPNLGEDGGGNGPASYDANSVIAGTIRPALPWLVNLFLTEARPVCIPAGNLSAPLALVLSPFTLCGGEGGGDHLSAFAYAIHGHEALEHFAIDKIDGSGDVLLGDGHCAGSQ